MCSSLVAATEKNNSKRAALQETQTIRSSVEVEDAEPNSKGDESDQSRQEVSGFGYLVFFSSGLLRVSHSWFIFSPGSSLIRSSSFLIRNESVDKSRLK